MKVDLLSLVLLGVLWVLFLWDPLMRTLRSVAFLALMTAVFLGATYLPQGLTPWLQSAAVAVLVLVLLFWSGPFVAIPGKVQDFVDALNALNDQLNRAALEFEMQETGRQEWRHELQSAAARLLSIEPPNAEWAETRAEVLDLLRQRIRLLDQPSVSEEQLHEFVARRERVHQRIGAARARSMSFWRL